MQKDGSIRLGDMVTIQLERFEGGQAGTAVHANRNALLREVSIERSPEVWKDQPYDHKSDIWSLGCVLYEMTTLKPPFRAEDMEGLYKKVIRGIYPKIPSHFSSDLSNTIKALL